MAALQGAFQLGPVSLTGGTAQTVIQLVAPTNQRGKILGYDVSFDGTNSANTPVNLKILRQTSGTFTNTAVAPVKTNDIAGSGETLQFSSKNTVTVEPTAGDILGNFTIPAFGGTYTQNYTPGQEPLIIGGTLLGFKFNAAQAVNVYLTVRYEE